MKDSFGLRLRYYRTQKDLTQQELSDKSGVSRKQISDFEMDIQKNPRLSTIKKLADALDIKEEKLSKESFEFIDEDNVLDLKISSDAHKLLVELAKINNRSVEVEAAELLKKAIINEEKEIALKKDFHSSISSEISESLALHVISQTREREELFRKLLPHTRIENAAYSDTENFVALRYIGSNTSTNCSNLIDYLNLPQCIQVILFATSDKPKDGYSRNNDGPETNLPLMGALAIVELPKLTAYVIFDGLFLTAQRRPRYLEVKDVLDYAETSNKTYFINQPVPFTSSWNPIDAVSQLIHNPTEILTSESRSTFFRLLSNVNEEQLK